MSGLIADSRTMIDRARVEAQVRADNTDTLSCISCMSYFRQMYDNDLRVLSQ